LLQLLKPIQQTMTSLLLLLPLLRPLL